MKVYIKKDIIVPDEEPVKTLNMIQEVRYRIKELEYEHKLLTDKFNIAVANREYYTKLRDSGDLPLRESVKIAMYSKQADELEPRIKKIAEDLPKLKEKLDTLIKTFNKTWCSIEISDPIA